MASLSTYPPETHAGTVTSWLPVETPWPSSSGCGNYIWSFVQSTLAAWDPGYGLSVHINVQCLPPAATTWWDQDHFTGNEFTRFSLGPITCPDSYTTGISTVTDQSSTFVACCPPNYTFVSIVNQGSNGQCSSDVPPREVVTYAVRNQNLAWIITSTSYQFATKAWGIQMNGYNIVPQTASPFKTSTSSTPSTAASTTPAPVTTAPVFLSGTPHSSSGLPTGVKVGIGVGVSFGVLAVLALIVFIFTHRRRRKPNPTGAPTGPTPAIIYELDGEQAPDISEIGGREVLGELYSKN